MYLNVSLTYNKQDVEKKASLDMMHITWKIPIRSELRRSQAQPEIVTKKYSPRRDTLSK